MRRKRHSCAAQMCAVCALVTIMAADGRAQESHSPLPESTPAEQTPAPSLRFEVEKLDFGVVQPGEIVEREILLHNYGSVPVGILDVGSSCQCTAVLAGQEIILPGEAVPISINVQSSNSPAFVLNQHVYVRTTDAVEPIYLPVRVVSKSFIEVKLHDIRLAERNTIEGTLDLSSEHGEEVNILGIRPNNVQILSTEQVGLRTSAHVRIQPNANGVFPSELLIQTDHPQQQEYRFSLRDELQALFASEQMSGFTLERTEIKHPFGQFNLGTADVSGVLELTLPFANFPEIESLEILCGNSRLIFTVLGREDLDSTLTAVTLGVRSTEQQPVLFRTRLTLMSKNYTSTYTIVGSFSHDSSSSLEASVQDQKDVSP